jgi:Ser/Thr protein kinase RdoA (MazF antagonist)
MTDYLKNIVQEFQTGGVFWNTSPYGTGHVNDTHLVICYQDGHRLTYTLQRINHSIFSDPVSLMDNIIRVTAHIQTKLTQEGFSDTRRCVLSVIPTLNGHGCHRDNEGNYWRMYGFIEGVRSYDYLNSPEHAYQAARTFGRFQRYLTDLPGPKLYETIPDFHNTPKRLRDFMDILDKDPCNRAAHVKEEIQFVFDNADIADQLLKLVQKGFIPERITHNDTKINNVLFDTATDKGICVIDLDTVMPGLSLYDFGDMVRTATCQAAEDEKDLSKIELDIRFFEQIARGYAQETIDFLTDTEKENLVFAGKLITFEQMVRFLGDYLNGDVYYKIHYPEHNLDRARTQTKLIRSILNQEDHMNEIENRIWKML